MKFIKYQGLGNDFIITKENIDETTIKKLCDRRFGIGADGIIIHTKNNNEYFMNFFNADGSRATMCGNGIRCYSQYLREYENLDNNFNINTLAGLKHINILNIDNDTQITSVDIGTCSQYKKMIIDKIECHYVNSGTDHVVIEVDNIDIETVKKIGYQIENNKNIFPNGTNVNFIKKINNNAIEIMTWERGVGITLACGTGAIASAYVINKQTNQSEIQVISKGGTLTINLENIENIKMIGESKKVFAGTVNI